MTGDLLRRQRHKGHEMTEVRVTQPQAKEDLALPKPPEAGRGRKDSTQGLREHAPQCPTGLQGCERSFSCFEPQCVGLHQSRGVRAPRAAEGSGPRPSQPGPRHCSAEVRGHCAAWGRGDSCLVLGAARPLPDNSQLTAELKPPAWDPALQKASEAGLPHLPQGANQSPGHLRAETATGFWKEGGASRQDFPVTHGSADTPTQKQAACDCQGAPRPGGGGGSAQLPPGDPW